MYTILIVDDEKSEREVILFLIKKYKLNLHTLQADNGKAALDILKEKPVDILLTDIKMPFINGMELATKARDIYPDIKILFFSGYDDFEYVKTALLLRAVNYILKPINENEFYKSILTIINTIHKRETQAEITDKYFEDYFYNGQTDENIKNIENNDDASIEEDSDILKNIEEAIQLKNTDEIRNKAKYLLDKYKNTSNVSHIYIRYICTTLLQLLIKTLPDVNENNFKNIVEKIFKFRYFTEIRHYIEEYLDKVVHNMEIENQSPKHAILIVKQYIHSHYKEDLSLNTLANIVYLSPKYLSSMFRQVTGISLNKYIKNVRLEQAKKLLLTTNLKVADICEEVGYSYVSYFCRIFQEEYGISPETFRERGGKIE